MLTKPSSSHYKDGLGKISKPPSHERDFRMRKYANLPEYLVCNYCGSSGHDWHNCQKRVNDDNKNIAFVRASETEIVSDKNSSCSNPNSLRTQFKSHPVTTWNTKKNVIRTSKQSRMIWVRKDQLYFVTNNKGPNLAWVPKIRN